MASWRALETVAQLTRYSSEVRYSSSRTAEVMSGRSVKTWPGRARITTAAGSAEALVEVCEAMQAGHAALPNGFGLDFTGADGIERTPGVAPNALTSADWCDSYAGTPWHKHVPARIEAVAPTLSVV